MIRNTELNQLTSMYPTVGFMLKNQEFILPSYARYCSIYGYSFGRSSITVDEKIYHFENKQYFSFGVKETATVTSDDNLFIVIRLGYLVPNNIGWIEEKGRLSYIDGCSDSLLVYPSRLGDPSLNLLYFPPGIEQTFHRHPSIRMGCVINGSGISCVGEKNDVQELPLEVETSFCLVEQERHRFRTTDNSMTVIAFHPDGDWGPTDRNHTMLNRTYTE